MYIYIYIRYVLHKPPRIPTLRDASSISSWIFDIAKETYSSHQWRLVNKDQIWTKNWLGWIWLIKCRGLIAQKTYCWSPLLKPWSITRSNLPKFNGFTNSSWPTLHFIEEQGFHFIDPSSKEDYCWMFGVWVVIIKVITRTEDFKNYLAPTMLWLQSCFFSDFQCPIQDWGSTISGEPPVTACHAVFPISSDFKKKNTKASRPVTVCHAQSWSPSFLTLMICQAFHGQG